jgi:hypothetical protein
MAAPGELLRRQHQFARMVAQLIAKANQMGYDVTLGEAWRSEFEAVRLAKNKLGIKRSLHCDRLAIDLNLFRGGIYLRDTESHRALGEWWESMGGSWGGRFNDGNHYSLEFEGRR